MVRGIQFVDVKKKPLDSTDMLSTHLICWKLYLRVVLQFFLYEFPTSVAKNEKNL